MAFEFTDRNLLFALVTLKNGFIEQQQFVDVLNQWSADKNSKVADLLVSNGYLESADVEALDALVDRQIRLDAKNLIGANSLVVENVQLESISDSKIRKELVDLTVTLSPGGTRVEVASQHKFSESERQILRQIADGESVDLVNASGSGGDFFGSVLSMVGASDQSRYEILRPHAKGGLGTVSVALDSELGREVALKEIRPSLEDDESARSRFEMEAFITGGLEHPGVVPVYGFGRKNNGSPFLAMKFVKGKTLKEAVLDYHKDTDASTSEKKIAFRDLLSRFVDCCNTIAYSHNRGVIHRDIKPSNIMMGKFGETLVVDWGLAKKVGREEAHKTPDEATLIINAGPGSTLDGSTVGTPAFMSPEQAQGKIEDLKPATDIYSLGATLYFILTGRAPFDGDSAVDVIAKVCVNDFIEPASLNKEVPAQLNSICCKAMATKPEERYLTGLQLAADIENWMADEKVAAHQESVVQKTSRWFRNHQAVTASLAAMLCTLLLASCFGFYLVNVERNKTESERRKIEVVYKKLRIHEGIVNRSLKAFSEALKTIADAAITNYLVAKKDDNTDVTPSPERTLIDLVFDEYEHLADSFGDGPESRSILGNVYLAIGDRERRLGELVSSRKKYGLAEAIFRQLIVERDDREDIRDLINLLGSFAILLKKDSKLEDAIAKEKEAIQLLLNLEEDENQRSKKVELATLYSNLGNSYKDVGRNKLAEENYRAADEILKITSEDSLTEYEMYVKTRNASNFASMFEKNKDYSGSVEWYRRSIEDLKELTERNSANPLYRIALAKDYNNLGVVLRKAGELDQAIDQSKLAMSISKELVRKYPNNLEFQHELGRNYFALGKALRIKLDKRAEANLNSSSEILSKLLLKSPGDRNIKTTLSQVYGDLGELYKKSDETQAVSMYRKSADLHNEIFLLSEGDTQPLLESLNANKKLVAFLLRIGRKEEAAKRLESAYSFIQAAPALVKHQLGWWTIFKLAELREDQEKFEQALEIWEKLYELKNNKYWSLFRSRMNICMIKAGQIDAGVVMTSEIFADETISAQDCYNCGACFAVAAELQTDEAEKERNAKRAVKALVRAGEMGKGDYYGKGLPKEDVARDKDLKFLHGRVDFDEFRKQFGIPEPKLEKR